MKHSKRVQAVRVPSWVLKATPAWRYEARMDAWGQLCAMLALGIIIVGCAVGMWQHFHRDSYAVNVSLTCTTNGGRPAMIRDARGEVLAVLCDHGKVWTL